MNSERKLMTEEEAVEFINQIVDTSSSQPVIVDGFLFLFYTLRKLMLNEGKVVAAGICMAVMNDVYEMSFHGDFTRLEYFETIGNRYQNFDYGLNMNEQIRLIGEEVESGRKPFGDTEEDSGD